MPPVNKTIKHPRSDGFGKGAPDNPIGQVVMPIPKADTKSQPWCGQYLVMDDGFWLVCEKREHKPSGNGMDFDKSPHIACRAGVVYEWGQDYEDSLSRYDHPYNITVSDNGFYTFYHLSGRDVGKFIEFDKGAITISGVIGSMSFYTDQKAAHKDQRKRARGERKDIPPDDGRRVSLVVVRNDDVQSFEAKLSDEFRLYNTGQ